MFPILKGDVSLEGADIPGGGGLQHPGHRHFSKQAPFPHKWERRCRTCRGSSVFGCAASKPRRRLPNTRFYGSPPSSDHLKLFKLALLGRESVCFQPCHYDGESPSCGGLALPRT